jgi:glycine/D-amino acid oxidase-like deaminating enzyme
MNKTAEVIVIGGGINGASIAYRLARDSVRVFENFAAEVGGDAGFVQCGVVFFCGPNDEAAMRKTVAMHHTLGIRGEILTGEELRKMEPCLASDDIAMPTGR